MKPQRISLLGIIVAMILIQPFGKVAADENKSAIPVETVIVERQPIEERLELTGSVAAIKSVTVYSKVNGVIEKLLVERGMKVKKGDVIAIVEHKAELAQREELQAAVEVARVGLIQARAGVEVAKAALAQAQAQLENASIEKTRIENLYKDKAVPKQKYDAVMAQYKIALAGRDLAAAQLTAAKARVKQAKAGLTQAQAALKRLDVRIADYTITAPISGVITARYVDEGAMDSPAMPIVQIMDTSILKVNCDVAQVNAGKVRVGQDVIMTSDTYRGVEFAGKVHIVNPALNPRTRTLPVEIRCNGKPTGAKATASATLKPGMFVKVNIITGTKQALVIPRDCLLRLPATNVWYVFVVKNNKAYKRTVTIGTTRGNRVEVIKGLKEGEKVVIKGQGLLKTGMTVYESK